ncbi:HAD family hydrolase [Winogradskyella eckloniae]|uniref:HAD family hydrolase n=1 Tax=Winogradskyella eckloniae TaxID=1089306 RepID=UPI001567A4E9|nr:HAD family hydrolase [Winogradskyella eckloniae]NRD21439.1 HAD family hydrolase [Winogradskyella eckloniae]
MEHIKMVITDMDGTLLNSKHEVSSRFFQVFKSLQQRNIQFVAASGRPYYSIIEKLKPIKDDIIIVAENGGLVIQNGNTLLAYALEANRLLELYTLVSKIENTYPIFCTKHKAYILNAPQKIIDTISEYYSTYTIVDSFEAIDANVIKIALYHSTNSERHILPYVSHLRPNLNVVVSGKHWVDISEPITNKGNAITFLQNHLHIKASETMVFGDYNNDLDMMKHAKFSYAMKNAHPNVKAAANFETKTNDNFGVEIILENLVSKCGKN